MTDDRPMIAARPGAVPAGQLRELGFEVVEHDWVPAGKAFVIAPGALRLDVGLPFVADADPYAFNDAARTRYLAEARVSFRRTVVERDPMEWPRPRTWRALLRQLRAIFGYEFRKAAGRPRRHPDPRDVALITGLGT